MITTANYILIAMLNSGQRIFEYDDTCDVWQTLNAFYGDDYQSLLHEPDSELFPIDVLAMESGKVIATYKLAFCGCCFDHFFAKGWVADGPYTLDRFYGDLRKAREELDKTTD